MLAYTVWHHARNEAEHEQYRAILMRFHQILAERKPDGYLSSVLMTIPGVPWMDSASRIFMDWYFVENAAALDSLHSSVLSGKIQESHDVVADAAPGGVTALYQPKFENENVMHGNYLYWLSKPKGMKYNTFYEELRELKEDNESSLWIRYLALGPGPEFCMVSSTALHINEKFEPLQRSVETVWRV